MFKRGEEGGGEGGRGYSIALHNFTRVFFQRRNYWRPFFEELLNAPDSALYADAKPRK